MIRELWLVDFENILAQRPAAGKDAGSTDCLNPPPLAPYYLLDADFEAAVPLREVLP